MIGEKIDANALKKIESLIFDSTPDTWIKSTLGDCFKWGSGGTPKSSNSDYYGGNIPWLVIGDLNDGIVTTSGQSITVEGLKNSSAKLVEEGTLLLAMYGSIGKLGIAGIKLATNQAIAFAIQNEIDTKYLFNFLRYTRPYLTDLGKGATQQNISQTIIKAFPFPLAPLNEQRRIVTKIETLFSELDNGIAALKTAKEQLKVYRQAVLKHAFEGKLTAKWRAQNADKLETPEQLLARIQTERETHYQQQLEEWKEAVKHWETNGQQGKKPSKPKAFKPMAPISNDEIGGLPDLPVGWVYARLAEISLIVSGMSVSKDRKLSEPVEVPYLRVANVQRGNLLLDEIKTMQVEKNSLAELTLEKWDVLFNEGGDRDKLGRGWVWEGQIESCITQNHVFRASPIIKSEYHSKFISHWGNSFGRDYFEKGGKQTTNLASINKTVLSNFPVPVPSMEEQQQLIIMLDDVMSQIDAMETEIENGIQRAETLRQSILKKAFSGQLVPQDPNDEPASELLSRIQDKKFNQKTKHVRQING